MSVLIRPPTTEPKRIPWYDLKLQSPMAYLLPPNSKLHIALQLLLEACIHPPNLHLRRATPIADEPGSTPQHMGQARPRIITTVDPRQVIGHTPVTESNPQGQAIAAIVAVVLEYLFT